MAVVDCKFGTLVSGAAPIGDPEILDAICSMDISRLTNNARDVSIVKQFVDTYDGWIRSSNLNRLHGFNGFKRCMAFAVTHAIEQFLMKHRNRRICIFSGEYPGTVELIQGYGLNSARLETDELSPIDAVIISAPFSGSGNQHEMMSVILDRCDELDIPVMIDCAFFGLCKGLELTARPCIETVAFSLSKCFSLSSHRVGMVYSRDVPNGIEMLHDAGYSSNFGAAIALELFERFGPDHAFLKYRHSQETICSQLGNMSPSDTVIFGNGNAVWNMFDRGRHNRISFAGFINTMIPKVPTDV